MTTQRALQYSNKAAPTPPGTVATYPNAAVDQADGAIAIGASAFTANL
jgi:hypothetical protein